MNETKKVWISVHEVLTQELIFRADSGGLNFQHDRLTDLADHLADVLVANFNIVPRTN